MTWLKRTAIAVGAVLLVMLAVAWWLLGTGAGLRFVVARAQAATDGALHVDTASGRLLGPLTLRGIRYHADDGFDMHIVSAQTNLRFWPLLGKRLHISKLNVEGVTVTLPTTTTQEPTSSSSAFSLQPPIDVIVDQAHLGKLDVTQAGQPVFATNSLDLAGRWTSSGIALTQLKLRAADGHADASGTLGIGKNYQGDGHADFAWTIGDTQYAGTLTARSDGSLAHATLALSKPMTAHLQLQLRQVGDFPWTANLDAPNFDPAPLFGAGSITKFGVALQGNGTRHTATLHGKLDVNEYALALAPVRVHFSDDMQTLTLDQLALSSDKIKGSLHATGVVHLDAQPVNTTFDAQWQDVVLPADLVGQVLASHGQLQVKGSTEQFHAESKLAVGPPGKLAALNLNLDGTPQTITLHSLILKQPQGGMRAHGTLNLQPGLAWNIDVTANKLDPGQLFAGWNGAVDFDLASNGTATPAGPDVHVDIHTLGGTLRQRPLHGKGKLHITPRQVMDGQLQLAAADSHVRIDAKPGATNDVDVKLAITSLGDWLPHAGGSLNGRFHIAGQPPKLSVQGQLDGQALVWREQHLDSLALTANVPDIAHPGGTLKLDAEGVQSNGFTLHTIKLRASGNRAKHQLTLDAAGPQATLALALHGSMPGNAWHGTLSTLDLTPQGLPEWRLQKPAQLSWSDGGASLSQLCLGAGDPSLCVTATQSKRGAIDASYQLHDVPLALLLTASGSAMPVRADGTIQGHGKLQRSADGALSGNAEITSRHGSITYVDRPRKPVLDYDDFTAAASLDGGNQHVSVNARLNGNGNLDGQLTIHGAQQTLEGTLDLDLPKLDFISLLTTDLAAVKGSIKGHFAFAGNVAKPTITGHAGILGFGAEIPAVGITLSDGHITLATANTRQWNIDGLVHSGKGQLAIQGVAAIDTSQPTAITIKGSDFTAANIPAAKLAISPDLTIKRDDDGLRIDGAVAIDSADVDLSKLPGGSATQASRDVVVVDEQQGQKAAALPITAKVRVDLGDNTHVQGLGLDGRIGGSLTVSERPGHETLGQGQLTVNGTYRAYGQDLHIERGQLLFASTPVDNPALNIRATRNLNPNATIDSGNKVGLDISGTAQRPILTVFSNPVMQQSDALSYLVTGKPLSQVKGGEGNMVGAAAQALGSAAGDMLAKSVGSKIGADVGVSSNEALGGGAALTVGKYLSPRLYLSYGVGLFEPGEVVTLRYILSKRWNFEALNATTFNRMMFNYRLER